MPRRVAIGDGSDLDGLKTAIARAGRDPMGSPYLLVVAPNDREEFSVVVDSGRYVIRDQPIPRIAPPLPTTEPGAAEKMVQRLEHLVQYRNAWELHNDVDSSELRDTLAISVVGKPTRAAGRVRLQPGEQVCIRVHNRSKRPALAVLFYFSPDWSITRIWPAGANAYEELKVTGDDGLEVFQATAQLPPGVLTSIERLKLFATDKPTSFDTLMLESLEVVRRPPRSTEGNPLENLLADMGEGKATRELVPCPTVIGDWSTAELELETAI